jgi:hypothetical protein
MAPWVKGFRPSCRTPPYRSRPDGTALERPSVLAWVLAEVGVWPGPVAEYLCDQEARRSSKHRTQLVLARAQVTLNGEAAASRTFCCLIGVANAEISHTGPRSCGYAWLLGG